MARIGQRMDEVVYATILRALRGEPEEEPGDYEMAASIFRNRWPMRVLGDLDKPVLNPDGSHARWCLCLECRESKE